MSNPPTDIKYESLSDIRPPSNLTLDLKLFISNFQHNSVSFVGLFCSYGRQATFTVKKTTI